LNHAFGRNFSKLGSFGFIYINGSYIWKSDLSWDLILNVFNSKPVTSSDKCTWNIIILGDAKTALYYIFLVVIHQPKASFFPAFLSWKRKKFWIKSLIWADQVLNLRWTTLKAILVIITQLVWFRCLLYLFFKYV
jgi:hypothetical protein